MADVGGVCEKSKHGPFGECIYCGETSDLTDEHAIPYALGGQLELLKASCKRCAKITGKFEGSVLRGFMSEARVVSECPTRRPKKRPKVFAIHITDKSGEARDVALSPAETPTILLLPTFPSARFLANRPLAVSVECNGANSIVLGNRLNEVATKYEAAELQKTVRVDAISFLRMIAKIGYCVPVATLGKLPREQVPALPFILGSTNDGSNWIGNDEFETLAEKQGVIHPVELGKVVVGREIVLVARVKLFSNSGLMGYQMVVQRRFLG